MKRYFQRLPLLFCILGISLLGADWPQFRGPGGRGRADATGLPLTWNAQKNIVWRTALPGFGASSPITRGDRIYLTCYSGYGLSATDPGEQKNLKRHLVCFDRAGGKILWNTAEDAQLPEQKYQGWLPRHGYTSGTPVIDGERIFVFYGRSGVYAYDLQGNRLWHHDVGDRTHSFGSGTSPVLYRNLVLVNASIESGELVALEKRKGKVVWKKSGIYAAWNTPVLVNNGERDEVVLSIKDRLQSFDPASGKPLWSCKGIDDYICPSVIAEKDTVYAIGSRSGTALAVRSGGKGDVTESHVVWRLNKGSNVSSPVFYEGHLYWAHESKGILYCANAADGTLIYQKRLSPQSGLIYASPVAVDGRLYYVSRSNGTYVLPAEPQFKLLAHNIIEDDKSVFNGSPAISQGQFLLRSDKFLYCIGK